MWPATVDNPVFIFGFAVFFQKTCTSYSTLFVDARGLKSHVSVYAAFASRC